MAKAEWPFPNFPHHEVACPCCGALPQTLFVYKSLSMIQAVRKRLGYPLPLNSAHRCWLKNVKVGGAPLSMHKKMAFDIPVTNANRFAILMACQKIGFTGFGYYKTFLHVDCGRARYWYGKGARELWNG